MVVQDERLAQPGGRKAAPGELALVQAFLNSADLEEGKEEFVTPEALRAWLVRRARAFPVLRDLVVDRSPLDRIIEAGGYISVNTGAAADANAIPVPKEKADRSMDAAACIGCGACVPTCPDHALSLIQKENCYVPPASTMEMYKNIMVERFGWSGTIKIAAKAALGMKV